MTESFSSLIVWIVLLPLIGAIFNGLVGRFLNKGVVTVVACGAVGLSFLVALVASSAIFMADGRLRVVEEVFTWVTMPSLTLQVHFVLDALSTIMVLVITGVGFLIHLYSVGYMRDDESYGRYFSYLNLFVFSMLILVLAGNLPLLFVGWEGVGLCSYLLIGFWFEDSQKAAAGKKAFIINRIGDLGFLLGMFVLFGVAGSLTFDGLELAVTNGTITPIVATIAALLFFVGAAGKSAQIPLYVWLPDAMAGPTPVSALIHAATMVTAGVYMVARLSFLYAIAPTASAVVVLVGAFTAIAAASIGICQKDIKKVLAYSTISQLGYMFVAVGVGAYFSGVFHLMTHAFFKACLFLGAGSVIHALSGEQNILRMGGLRKKLPWTYYTFLIATLALAGFPPLAGFFSKDEILWQALSTHSLAGWAQGWVHITAYILCLIAAAMTAFYMFRLLFLTFHGTSRLASSVHVHKESRIMSWPLVVLAILTIVSGFFGASLLGIHSFKHFLDPVLAEAQAIAVMPHAYAASHGMEMLAALVSVVVALSGSLLAYLLYIKSPALAATLQLRWRRLHSLVDNKYWVDEIYHAIFVRPLHSFSRFLRRFVDEKLIDDFGVNGPARLFVTVGNIGRRVQTGDLQYYAFWFVVGVSGLTFYWIYVTGWIF